VSERRATSLPELFFGRVAEKGDAIGLRHKDYGIWNRVTWREYGDQVRQVAAGLMASGLQPGDRVAVLGENRPEWQFCHLGTMTAGGATTGIYPTNAPEEIAYVVNHSESKILFVENEEQVDKILQIIDDLVCEQVVIWDPKGLWGFSHPRLIFYDQFLARGKEFLETRAAELDARTAAIKPEDTAMIVYTSGTTGRPKGAMLTHQNILFITESFISMYPPTEHDELLSYLPLAHIYENLMSVYMAIWNGATVNFVESLDTLPMNLREVSPTVFASVPRIWEKFVSAVHIRMSDSTIVKRLVYRLALGVGLKYVKAKDEGKKSIGLSLAYWLLYALVLFHLRRQLGMERIRYAICAAAPASPELFQWYNAIGVKLREGYGQTESTGVIAVSRVDAPRYGYVGQVIPGVEAKIAEDGEILVRGEGVFAGYFKEPKLSADTIVDGWLHTGDVGSLDGDYLQISDRKKDIIITRGGKNITPAFIENKLKFSTYIQDAVVIGDNRKFLTALILIDEDNVTKYATDNRIPFTTFEDLTQNAEINQLIDREVAEVNKTLARVETIKKFKLLPRRFYEEDGDVTPTKKIKRRSLEKRYAEMIDDMYQG
jgi:long-chain acyl-CoA synthetase